MEKTGQSIKRTRKSGKLCAIIAIILSLALLLQTVSAAASAVPVTDSSSTNVEQNSSYVNLPGYNNLYGGSVDIQNISDDQIVGELEEKREESRKYFRLIDGTILAATYDSPVHKLDANGKWQEISFELSDNGNEYENTDNSMQVKFSKNPKNGHLYTLKTDDGQIKWGLLGVKESAKQASLTQSAGKPSKLAVNNVSGCVSYDDILSGVTLQYFATEGQLKENIIFANCESAKPLQFELQTNKFSLTLENNVIYFANANGDRVYSMSAPWMMDSNGATSEAITLGLSGSKNHYTVTVTPDAEWLSTAAYPVTVDPVWGKIFTTKAEIDTVYVASAQPTTSHYAKGSMAVGREQSQYGNARTAIKFELPSDVSSADRVIAANLLLTQRSFEPANSSKSVTVNIHQITSSVNIPTLTWNTLNGKYSPIVSDSQVLTLSTASSHTQIPFDITTMVRDWYQNGNNYGVALTSDNENGAYNHVTFYTRYNTGVEAYRYPALVIQYSDNSGLEDNLTYHTAGGGDMGVISVNDFNGNLVYMFEDASTDGNLFPVSVSHIFDNSRRNEADADNTQGDTYFGKGFRLNLYERIIAVSNSSLSGYPYKYIDADGTVHYFKAKGNSNDTYVDEFYPSRVIKLTKENGTVVSYTMTNGSDIESTFDSNGYLTKKTNKITSKKAEIHYVSGTHRVSEIVDGAGKVITFTYVTNGGKYYLDKITDTSSRNTVFGYTNGLLTTITRPGNRVITLNYDSNNSITKVSSYDGTSIGIAYYSTTYNDAGDLRRVHTLTEYGKGNVEGKKLTFTYGTGETAVTDRDGKTETMMFDDFGQTVCVRDNEGRATLLKFGEGDTSNSTENTADVSKSVLLEYTTKLQATVNNFVANPDFEDTSLNSWSTDTVEFPSVGNALLATEQAYMGSRSLKIRSVSETVGGGCAQTVDLPNISEGQVYTASAHVKLTDVTLSSDVNLKGALIYLGVKYTNGTWNMLSSEPVQTVGDWTRVSVNFTMPANVASVFVKVGLVGCTGIAYFDNVQVEKGSVANSYNMVDNGDFGDAVGTTTLHDYSGENLTSADKVVTVDGRNCFVINGARKTDKNLSQTITASGTAGDKYTFSAWAKSTGALSLKGSIDEETRDFRVRVSFLKSNGDWEHHYFDFESKTTNWQFLAGEAIADSAYTAVRISVLYNRQKNAAYFDDLCLFKEGSNTHYTYDSWQRVETVRAADKSESEVIRYTYVVAAPAEGEESTVEVDTRVSRIDYPDNTNEIYEYDPRTKQLTRHIDVYGVKTIYHYDVNGNLKAQHVDNNTGTGQLLSSETEFNDSTAGINGGNYAVKTRTRCQRVYTWLCYAEYAILCEVMCEVTHTYL